jgi:cysteine desulfurase
MIQETRNTRREVYLDNHATTRVDDDVVTAMVPYFTYHYGNASSLQHRFGWKAEAGVEHARGDVAALLHSDPSEITFTSGATESINLAIRGTAELAAASQRHIITVATEHHAVLDVCASLARGGYTTTVLPVDEYGRIDPDQLRHAITGQTALVCIMAANNEIGTIAPLKTIGSICAEAGVPFFCDATQAPVYQDVHVNDCGISMLAMSAHKIHGPKGVGALYVKKGLALEPVLRGGGQEKGVRPGTLNVPGIVGFGVAARTALEDRADVVDSVRPLRDFMQTRLLQCVEGARVNGDPTSRLVNNLNITLTGINADQLMMKVKDVAMSTGSACSSSNPEPSHVLQAIGLRGDALRSTLRFGLSKYTTASDIEYASTRILEAVTAMRLSPAAAAHS